jgi:Acyl-CoA dehydrogenase N terminal
MPSYKAPLEDVSFLLNDVFQIDRYNNLPGFSDASPDVREAILAEAAKFSEEVLQPLNRIGDLEMMMAASPRRRVLRRPTSSSAKAAGSACRRPRNMADRACPPR